VAGGRQRGAGCADRPPSPDLNDGGRVYLTQNRLRGRYVIHFAIGQIYTTREHVLRAFEVIKATARGSSKTAQQ
jgi:hypothetical protein